MFSLPTVPIVGIGLLVIGLIGFVFMAIVLDDHPELFALIICWYALAISTAGFALGKGGRHAASSRLAMRKKTAENRMRSGRRG